MKNGLKAKILLSESFSVRTPTGPMWNMFCRITSSLWELRHINPARKDLGNSYRMKRKLRNSCSQQERNKRPFHDSVGFASCVRASLTLPRAILRMTAEKAGAGMCRLGLGQGGCVCPPFRFLCHRGFLTLHDIDAFRCIVAEISDNLAGNKRTIVLIISALK